MRSEIEMRNYDGNQRPIITLWQCRGRLPLRPRPWIRRKNDRAQSALALEIAVEGSLHPERCPVELVAVNTVDPRRSLPERRIGAVENKTGAKQRRFIGGKAKGFEVAGHDERAGRDQRFAGGVWRIEMKTRHQVRRHEPHHNLAISAIKTVR